jgi:hypothetical protein
MSFPPKLLDDRILLVGENLGLNVLDPECTRNGKSSRAVVARKHHDFDTFRAESLKGFPRRSLYWVGNREHRARLLVNCYKNGCGPARAECFAFNRKRGRGNTKFSEEPRRSD